MTRRISSSNIIKMIRPAPSTIYEADEFNTTERNNTAERLQTEYHEEDQSFRLMFTKSELTRWLEMITFSLAALICLCLLDLAGVPVILAILPMGAYEVRLFYVSRQKIRNSEM